MAFKISISDPKTRKAYQKEVDEAASGLVGKKISEKIQGDIIGLAGYEIEVTGGSDKDGFPMRKDIEGVGRKRVLVSEGPGFKPTMKGERQRKSIRGNTVSAQISQINVKVTKSGEKTIEELWGVKAKESPWEKKKAAKAAGPTEKSAETAQAA